MVLTIVLFLGILTLLVLVHEYGHFFTARKFGLRVYEFGIGFPPRLGGVYRDPRSKKFIWVWGKGKSSLRETGGGAARQEEFPATLYSVNLLPIGGFCKIKGESGEDTAQRDSFSHARAGQRLTVLLAGVFMNILLAMAVMSAGFMIGLPTDVTEGVPPGAFMIGMPQIMVQEVTPGSPAASAGIQLGDAIVSLDGSVMPQARAVTAYVKTHENSSITVGVMRQGNPLSFSVTPRVLSGSANSEKHIGLALADAAMIRFVWYKALFQGAKGAVFGLINIYASFFILLKGLLLGKGLAFQVSGPVGIASLVGQSARLGWHYVLQLVAMISLSLAAVNLLPIPALDGGRAFFVLLEKIRRRPVAVEYEQLAHTIGFFLLIILFLIVTWHDIFHRR